ncbi:acyl carrier protein [Pseudozobellia thermophila]|uniref:Acyl carrier protein n=1 Tax=Pseudozobellia thermophila TaxID=192903 RepID=A0A1M6ITV6_9FLAO|nr:acyl carrier protein [Pseudozobellia thermophila]SHJ37789.1 Acyl carrier protein [Pseudozobellia thermophila]
MKDKIAQFIIEHLANETLATIDGNEDLLGNGIIDSLGMMQLINYIENEAGIQIPPQDMVLENFMTIENMMAYITSSKEHKTRPQ